MSTNCRHVAWSEGDVYGFAGPIFGAEEDRRAHGGVSWTDTCRGCGARRGVNANQGWREEGPGGPSRSEREGDAARREAAAREAVASVPPLQTASLDSEGYVITSSKTLDDLPASWVEAAKRARRAVLVATAARRNV